MTFPRWIEYRIHKLIDSNPNFTRERMRDITPHRIIYPTNLDDEELINEILQQEQSLRGIESQDNF